MLASSAGSAGAGGKDMDGADAVQGATGASAADQQSLLQRIRAEFHEACGVEGHVTSLSAEDLALYWERLAEETHRARGRTRLTQQNKQTIALRVAQLMQEMDLCNTGKVKLEEWMHYMLLTRWGQKSGFASRQVNGLLSKALSKSRGVLSELQKMFDSADVNKVGSLGLAEISSMYRRKLWRLKPTDGGPRPLCQLSDRELEAGDPEQFARDIIEAMDIDGDSRISYPEFMAYSLGRRKQEVLLHMYDLSNGSATNMAPYIIGEKLEGVWHTGTVVYGKEYYYSKDTVFADAGDTSFGKPTRIVSLGYTLWRQEELHEFVTTELKPVFQRDTYDVVCNNCNHFSDRLCMFLVGKQCPQEVLRQPDLLLKSRSVRVIRPLLNWWLRDRIVVREKGVELPPGQQRLKLGEQPALGKIVSIHAEKNDGPPILGKVCSAADVDGWEHSSGHGAVVMGTSRPTSQYGADSLSPKQARGFDPSAGCGGIWSTCSVVKSSLEGYGGEQEGVWVQYLDVQMGISDAAYGCRAQVRVECVPHARISPVGLSGDTGEVIFRRAMKALQESSPGGTISLASVSREGRRLQPGGAMLASEDRDSMRISLGPVVSQL